MESYSLLREFLGFQICRSVFTDTNNIALFSLIILP